MADHPLNSLLLLPPIQDSLLSNLNAHDYVNLRLAGIFNLAASRTVLGRVLGAQCDEPRLQPGTNVVIPGPCPSGPQWNVRMQYCDEDLLPVHQFRRHNVCEPCRDYQRDYWSAPIQELTLSRLICKCKKHSMMIRRRLDEGHDGCNCWAFIHEGWKCRSCYNQRRILCDVGGQVRCNELRTIHKVKNRRSRTGAKKTVFGEMRIREACPGGGGLCGAKSWTLVGKKDDDGNPLPHSLATFMCIQCDGEYVPLVV